MRAKSKRQASPVDHGPTQIALGYVPTERQQLFHSSPARYRLYGGAAGGGKSEATLFEHVQQCLETPGWQALILRRTYPELAQSLIGRLLKKVPGKLFSWNGTRGIATFNNGSVGVPGSTLRFAHCQHETDVEQFRSDEYGSIGFDELTTFTFYIWTFLTTRNRTHIPGTFSNMTGATNPEGIGLRWVRSLWVQGEPAEEMDKEQADVYRAHRDDYDFIPAKVTDNPHMLENDPTYIQTLEGLPTHLRLALLEGRWDVTAGTYFDCWDTEVNEVEEDVVFGPNALHRIEPWTPKWNSTDWGFAHRTASYWHAFVPPKIITYREQVLHRTTPEKVGHLLGSITKSSGEELENFFLSHDAFAERTSERTIAIEMGEALAAFGLPWPTMADRDRPGGAMLMYQLIQSGQWLVVAKRCPWLVKAIPSRQRDPDNTEDVLKDEKTLLDDCYDAARYGLKTWVGSRQEPIERQIEKRITSKIPTIAMAQRRKAEYDLRKGTVVPFRRRARRW